MATCKGTPATRVIDPWLLAILAAAIAVRLYGITHPLVDFSSWRQVDTASVARNFLLHDFNPLHPQLDYDGPGPNYSQLELQITTAIIALLFKAFGTQDICARTVPVLFFAGATVFLYLLVRGYAGRLTANLTALVFSMLPMGVYYSRAVQPEAAMLFFGIASLYYFALWCERETAPAYILAVAGGALAVLAKIPNIFLFIPIMAIAWDKFGRRTLADKRVILYFAIVIAVTAAYFGYLGWLVANFGSPYDYHNYAASGGQTGAFVSNIAKKHVVPELLTAWVSPEAIDYYNRYLPGLALTWIGLVLLYIGALPLQMHGTRVERLRPFYAWGAAMVLYVLTIAAVIRIDYYLVPILPIAAFFIARALAMLAGNTATRVILAALLVGMAVQSYMAAAPLYTLDKELHRFGIELKEELRPKEPVILGTFNPAILYYSGHRGWRSDDLSLDEFTYLRSEGAGYYIPLNSVKDKQLAEYLESNYSAQKTRSGLIYYDLRKTVD